MPRGLVRFQHAGVFHFITFSCYHRRPLLARPPGYEVFERTLETIRKRHQFIVAGYVLMPEHVHLLLNEPKIGCFAATLQVLKQETSKLLKRPGDVKLWQTRYYDHNVWSEEKPGEKLRYMHRNPVKRGLVAAPEEWPWSSFRHYATGRWGPSRSSLNGLPEDGSLKVPRSPTHESMKLIHGWGTPVPWRQKRKSAGLPIALDGRRQIST